MLLTFQLHHFLTLNTLNICCIYDTKGGTAKMNVIVKCNSIVSDLQCLLITFMALIIHYANNH